MIVENWPAHLKLKKQKPSPCSSYAEFHKQDPAYGWGHQSEFDGSLPKARNREAAEVHRKEYRTEDYRSRRITDAITGLGQSHWEDHQKCFRHAHFVRAATNKHEDSTDSDKDDLENDIL